MNEPARASTRLTLRFRLSFMLVLLMAVAGAIAMRYTPQVQHAMSDFGLIHLGGLCLIDRCDPYIDANLLAMSSAHREPVPHKRERLVYLPSALVMSTTLAWAGWPAAGVWWNCLSLLAAAVLCVVMTERLQLERFLLAIVPLMLFVVGTPFITSLKWGNPALMSAALTALGCVLAMPRVTGRKDWSSNAGSLLLGVALALKPQMAAGPVLVLLFYRPAWRAAVKAVLVGGAVLAIAVLMYRIRLGSFDFLHNFLLSQQEVMASGGPSDQSAKNAASVTFLGLQVLGNFLGWVQPWPAVMAWTAPVLLAIAAWRSGALSRLPWCTIALVTLLQLFPVYHRPYDRTLLLLLVPAIVELVSQGYRRLSWLLMLAACFWYLFDQILYYVAGRLIKLPLGPMLELVLCGILLGAMWVGRRDPIKADMITSSELLLARG